MSTFITIFLFIIVLVLVYALALRPWLKTKPWAQVVFTKIEPLEIALFKKSETVLVGRLVWLGGSVVTIYDGIATYFSNMSWEPLTTRVMDLLHVPQDLRGLTLSATLTGLGLAIVHLRKRTTQPLTLVAAPADLPPVAAAAVARADATEETAVAAVATAAADAKV